MGTLLTFATEKVPPQERRAAWRHFMREVYFKLDVATDGDALEGMLARRNCGEFEVSRLCITRSRTIRDRAAAADDKVERFCFVFPRTGSFDYRQGRIEDRGVAGSAFVLNTAEPYVVDHSDGAEMVCLSIPADRIRGAIRLADDRCFRGCISGGMVQSTLCHMLDQAIVRAPAAPEESLQALCCTMLDMMLVRRDA